MNKKIKILLERGTEEIIEKDHLARALASRKKLRVKFGIDPTAPEMHLGHTVPLRKLKQFQDLGHKAVLIIGDFTARIGDPSGRNEERKPLTEKEVKNNMKKYIAEAGKVIDIKKAEIRYNSEWYEKKNGLATIIQLSRAATIQQVLRRADFKKRLDEGNDITILEFLYSIFQGYDSVAVRADVELGGTDQKFNLLMGRRVQRHYGLPEQDIVTVQLIEGTDGIRKMSKSYGNYICIAEKPNEMFGKIMTIPDVLIDKYFTLLTNTDCQSRDAYQSKLALAEAIVGMYHSAMTAKKAKEEWMRTFSKKEIPENIPNIQLTTDNVQLIDLLLKTGVKSKSEARRLIEQNAVEIDGAVKKDAAKKINLRGGEVLKIGKKRFYKISLRR